MPAVFSIPRAYGILFPQTSRQNMITVLNYYKMTVPQGKTLVIPFNLKRLNQEVVEFHFKDWPGEILVDLTFDELGQGGKSYLLTMELDGNSYYHGDVIDDSLNRWNAWLRQHQVQGGVKLYSVRRFAEAGITAKIFEADLSVRSVL